MVNLLNRFASAYKAFRQPDIVVTDMLSIVNNPFISYESRRIRYDILWAFYENSLYDSIHSWSTTYKSNHDLYRHIRSIYNPTSTIVDFWKSHLWGTLDILSGNDQLKEDIQQVWNWSNWSLQSTTCAMQGALFGDSFIKVVDDQKRSKVYFEVVHAGNIVEITKDAMGNIKGYTLIEQRIDYDTNRPAEYKEQVTNIEGLVTFETFKDNRPHSWNSVSEYIEQPYDFVPLVHIQHSNAGLPFGLSEIHTARSKIHEVDDLASIVSDYIRKQSNPVKILTGVKLPPNIEASTKKRDEQKYLTGTGNANYTPLVTDLDLSGSVSYIRSILDQLENEYPELQLSKNSLASGSEKSGKSINELRKPIITKVTQARRSYDDSLIRANQMALTIGGLNGYFNYGSDSFDKGMLDHKIADRDVFDKDELEHVELTTAKTNVLVSLVNSGASLKTAAIIAGFTPQEAEQLNEIEIIDIR